MAASTAGAVKAHVEAQGLGLTGFRDTAPQDQPLPYFIVIEGLSLTPEGVFPAHDDPEGHVNEVVQVDLWMQWRHPTTKALTESYTLPDALTKALHGVRLTAAPKAVSGLSVVSRARLLDREANTVRFVWTLSCRRVLV